MWLSQEAWPIIALGWASYARNVTGSINEILRVFQMGLASLCLYAHAKVSSVGMLCSGKPISDRYSPPHISDVAPIAHR